MLKFLILLIPTFMCLVESGVVIDLDIVGHAIPLLKLSDGKVCFCPEGYNCPVPPRCQRDFQMVAEMEYGTRFVETTEPMIINANGEIENNRGGRFRMHILQNDMPKSIHVSVSSWGAIALDGEIVPLDNFTDTKAMDFLIPLKYVFLFKSFKETVHDNGTLDQGSLDVQYSIDCIGAFPHQFCELKCVKSETNSNLAHCISNQDASFWICEKNGRSTQCRAVAVHENNYQVQDEMMMIWKFAAASIMCVIGFIVGFFVRYRLAIRFPQFEF